MLAKENKMSETDLNGIEGDILIVDDDVPSLQTLSAMLLEQGYGVRRARDAQTALMIINNAPPDLILLDVRMPEMDGYELCQRLKANEESCDIPVLFLSALDETVDKIKGFKVGGVDYITKPFEVEEVLTRVQTHLNLFKLQHQLEKQNVNLKYAIKERKKAQSELQKSHDELEQRVKERTAKLKEANVGLKNEITERKRTEEALKESDQRLRAEIEERKRRQEELRHTQKNLKKLKDRLQHENIYLREEIKLEHKHGDIIGKSSAIKYVLRQAEQVAQTKSTVLLQGETGTGKELLARMIHNLSSRKERALVTVNCSALPPGLIESELFGREKGAYTGALTKQLGRFEIAGGSTIFLDEVSELPLDLQAKLLRVLQDEKFERLGGTETIEVDVRVIAATNRDLAKAMSEGSFREDLYYRLNVFPITVPPLHERQEDIPLLVWAFVREFEKSMGKRITTIKQARMEEMQRYPWPGNVRELRNVVEQAMIVSKGRTLNLRVSETMMPGMSQNFRLETIERNHIITILEKSGWRVKGKNGAAELLGLRPSTLFSKMKKFGIKRTTNSDEISPRG
jgi:DNA-binding NtrC family response regulator